MTISTIFLLLLALLLATALSFFQYFYKNNNKNKVNKYLALLRFLSIFGILVLLINPKITKSTFETIKTPLPILVDNSSSIVALGATQTSLNLYKKLTENNAIQDKFEVQSFQFDSQSQLSTDFNFKGNQTNIDEVAQNVKNTNKNSQFPTILITDGNQTSGSDYVFSFDPNNKVFPLVLGDTTTFLDLKINQLNVNKYAFHKNKFPAEVFLQYAGNKNIAADFKIMQGNTMLFQQNISFSASKKSEIIKVLLPAENIGLQVFKAIITSNQNEKNSYNNTKNFAVQVIDQKSEIAIVSSINHPDIGALKRAIETNAQRKVSIFKPNEINDLSNFNVVILYQPTTAFKSVFESLKNKNSWIITGTNTDFAFLNLQQSDFSFKMSNQKEDYLADFKSDFNLFAIDNIGFEQLPPLQNAFGSLTTAPNVEVLLQSYIRNIATNAPLLAFAENQGKRNAYLLGENIWRWRLQSHVDNQSFEKFDVFIDKIIQYLSSNNSKKALIVNHESFYNSGDAIEINAQFFNKNYEFDQKASLTISVVNKATKQTTNYDLLKGSNAYKVNLDGLLAGKYNFLVKEQNSNSVYNGSFEILDFDIEKQFVNPDLTKLKQLAAQTKGQIFMPNQVDNLIKTLLQDPSYKAIQKAIVKKTPLIDLTWLLILIAITLAAEWFIRKYNGML